MKAILTVLGKDKVGIVAKVSQLLAENDINILDVSQTLMADNFVMMMMVNVPQEKDFASLTSKFTDLGKELGVEINLRNEELYDAMHQL
ncbi:ACT domain-containing protein [uncultured Lactobacillus sp.]|uniref:ACT domain-containing protein n=1 Tax=uncultured Lactobacillus sp. TaxID=153152 RepID=UPI00261DDDDC|nr:ACT domain-containing protein [uncultured Lactobacillus sp.]